MCSCSSSAGRIGELPSEEMRGFAIATPNLQVIVVNGKDYSQGGKAFTLLHELCHVLLGESAISNGAGDDPELKPGGSSGRAVLRCGRCGRL